MTYNLPGSRRGWCRRERPIACRSQSFSSWGWSAGSGASTYPREMEKISRGPTFGDFVTIITMQDNTVARLQSTKVQTPLSPLY